MVGRNSPVVIAIVLATLGAIFLVLRAVTVWAAPPSTGQRRPPWPMLTSPEAAADAVAGDDGPHGHGSSADHAGDGGDGGNGH